MSKIKLTGNASGTGVLTVTAPNTNTDRTISLPDTTDTLAVNSDVTNKLPLAGGTMSGNLIVNASVNAAGSGTGGGFHFADGNAMIYRDTNDMVFKLQGAEKIRLPSSGGLTFNGDTAAANALDDYEEGTFTPVLGGTSASGTISGGSATGLYTKIGNMCYFQFRIQQQTLSGASGSIRITGLPFTAANTGSAYPSHAWGMTLNLNFDNSKNQAWYHEGTTLYTLESVSGAAWTDRAVTNASSIYMNQCGAYRVA